jgi:hypothetical protein
MKDHLLNLVNNSFGFDPAESTHYFMVDVPRGAETPVNISEHLTWDAKTGPKEVGTSEQIDGQIRVVLARLKWDAIADEVRTSFNQRLKKIGQHAGAWRTGFNLIRRELGKELVLLAWAIEEADPALISNAIINWKGLEPEERWWLYTQTAAATGHGLNDRGRGWRKAVRYALTENPVQGGFDQSSPEFFRRANAGPIWKHFETEEDNNEENQQLTDDNQT